MAPASRRITRPPALVMAVVAAVLLLLLPMVHALPKGFVAEVVSQRTKAVTGVFVPNPRRSDQTPLLMVASKRGRVRVLEDPDESGDDSTLVLDLSGDLCNNGERGLTSLAAHPDFGETRWVYLYYTRWREGCLQNATLGPQNVLVRYTMNATTLLLEDPELLLEGGILAERVHNGGAMAFGTDGYLYLATGDGGLRASVQDRRNLHGSLLRLKDDGSVPEDNPYAMKGVPCGKSNGVVPKNAQGNAGEDVFCSEIFAWGFRNPIRLAIHPEMSDASKVLFSISDVGAQQFEEMSWAGTDYREKNYGWPQFEGPCVPNTVDDCPLPPPESNLVDPFHYYVHTSYENGGCVAGSAFVPEGLWPKSFQYLFIDFIFLKIYSLVEDPEAECRESCAPPTSRFINQTFYESPLEEGENVNEARMIDMFFGPYKDTQALYVIKYGNNNSILRIRYIGQPPVAILEVQNTQPKMENVASVSLPTSTSDKDYIAQELLSQRPFLVGEVVRFDASRSFDPDGTMLTFKWDFGDGNDSTSNTTHPSHSYEEPGEYTVILVVANSRDRAQLVSTKVVVGVPPAVVMLSPMEGDLFTTGEVLRLEGEAFDYLGNVLSDSQMTWEIYQYHSTGFDTVLEETKGNDYDVSLVLEPEDAEKSFLRVILTVTDDNGWSTTVATDIYPDILMVELITQPKGLKMRVDGNEFVTPTKLPIWVDFDLPVEIPLDQPPYQFQYWSDGNKNSSRFISMSQQVSSNITGLPQGDEATVTLEAIFCLIDYTPCSDGAASCCSGYCGEKGFCGDDSQTSIGLKPVDSVPLGTPPNETNVDSELNPNREGEPDRKPPVIPGMENDVKINRANSDTKIDKSFTQEGNNNSYGMRPSQKWFVGVFMALCLILPVYFGWKYYELKRKIDTESINLSKDYQDQISPSKMAEPSLGEKNSASNPIVDSDETNASYSSSNASCSSVNVSFNKSGGIWEKIAKETERRAKLRAKYSSGTSATVTTPGTPDTVETGVSPSNLDSEPKPNNIVTTNIDETLVRLDDLLSKTRLRTKYSSDVTQGTPETVETGVSPSNLDSEPSPSNILTTNIDETLVRLDDLLSKTFSRKLPRSGRKQDKTNFSSEEDGTNNNESGLSKVDAKDSSEECGLAPIWLASNQDSVSMSPLREKNDAPVDANFSVSTLYAAGSSPLPDKNKSPTEANFSISSLYAAGSLQENPIDSQALKLPEVSNIVNSNSLHSLLVFQDSDLSMSNRGSIISENDTHDDLMESGLVGDFERTTKSDLDGFDQSQSRFQNASDLNQ